MPEQADARRARGRGGRAPCPARVDSRSCVASGSRTRPTGTFSQKIHCHEMPSTTAPPTSGPIATARPAMPDHAPSASAAPLGRDRGAEDRQRQRRHDRAADALDGAGRDEPRRSTAPARPRADAAVKIADADHEHAPAGRSGRRARRRSAGSTANVRVYAFTVHSSSSIVAPRSTRMTGSAVETTRLSSTTMKQRDRRDRRTSRACASRLSWSPPRVPCC